MLTFSLGKLYNLYSIIYLMLSHKYQVIINEDIDYLVYYKPTTGSTMWILMLHSFRIGINQNK